MFTINVLTRVLTVGFCLNKVGFSLPENVLDNAAADQNVDDQNFLLKKSNDSERIGARRRVKFTKRITERMRIFDQLLASSERRSCLMEFLWKSISSVQGYFKSIRSGENYSESN